MRRRNLSILRMRKSRCWVARYTPFYQQRRSGLFAFILHSYPWLSNVHSCESKGQWKELILMFTCLMHERSDHLKWPFRGDITIQIVNQDGDHHHVEKTIPYNDKTPDNTAGRVTGKNRAVWGFPEFFPLANLGYNPAKKTQYGKDGVIIVRVVKVSLL